MDEEDLDKEIESPLPGDFETPFSEPTPQPDDEDGDYFDEELREEERKLEDTHPVTDASPDKTQLYQEGLTDAAGAEEPNAGNSVVDYDSDKGEPHEQPPAKH